MEKIKACDYLITKFSKEDIASFIEMIYKNEMFTKYIESISNFDKAKSVSARLAEFILQYTISTGKLDDQTINEIVSRFKEHYDDVCKNHDYKNSKTSIKEELFQETVEPLIFDQLCKELGFTIPLSMSDSIKVLKVIKLSSHNNKFLTHSFNSAFLDDYLKNGIKLNNVFSNEVSNYIKLSGGNQPYKMGVLCTIELSESSFSYADIVPESIRNIYSNGKIKDGESMQEYLLRSVQTKVGDLKCSDGEKVKIIADSEKVIDFYYGHNSNSIAVIDNNNGIISNDDIQYFTIINSMLNFIYEYKRKTNKEERIDDEKIKNLETLLRSEIRNASEDSVKRIDLLLEEIRGIKSGDKFVKEIKSYAICNYTCTSCLCNFEQSFGDGYEVEGGFLPRDKFAVATYESPVKNNLRFKNKVTKNEEYK